MKGFRQKIDKAAMTQLFESARSHPASWGEGDKRADEIVYSEPQEGPDQISVWYEGKKQLLGGVFSLVFKAHACFDAGNCVSAAEGNTEMFYAGRFVKGEAYFKSKDGSDGISSLLNSDKELIRLLSELDLLSCRVSFQDRKLTYSLSPLGGAYTYTVFPPVKYGGVLPARDMERIGQAIKKIAACFETEKLAAGAE